MKTKVWSCLFAAAVLIAAVLCVRQRTLNELRASNQSLRDQLDSHVPTPTAGPTRTVQSTNRVAVLSPDEHAELLRLRGQILPLRHELQQTSNRVVTLARPLQSQLPSQPRQTATEPANAKAEIQKWNEYMRSDPYKSIRNLNIALGEYVNAHGGELPVDLGQIEALARTPLPVGTSQRFELIRSGKLSGEEQSSTLVAREKEPQQIDGKWVRSYLRADGGTLTAKLDLSPKPNWKAWEYSTEKRMKQDAAGKK